jgi:glutamate 5-kinase
MTDHASILRDARRIVIKIGSAQLIDWRTGQAHVGRFYALGCEIAELRKRGVEVVLVSSGAVALGRPRLNLPAGQKLRLDEKQAAAAAGQPVIIQAWDQEFSKHGFHAAQALLSPSDTESRRRWLNSRNTLETLLSLGAVPVVNENDTVATEKLRYGDNDRLAARVAQLVSADLLVILSDVDGLYDADPTSNPDAEHIPYVEEVTAEISDLAGPTRAETAGTGGMATKIAAAEMAMAAGCSTVIARGDCEQPITDLLNGGRATWFQAEVSPESAKRVWIAKSLAHEGKLFLDEGATDAVKQGHSLLAAGLTDVEGRFGRGHAIRLVGHDGTEFATALPGYDSDECRALVGIQSDEIEATLGYKRGYALVHAADLVLDEPKIKQSEGASS